MISKTIRLTAFASVLMLLTVALSPCVFAEETEDVEWRQVTMSELYSLAYGQDESDGDPVYGLGALGAGFIIGLAVGIFATKLYYDLTDSASNPYDDTEMNTAFSQMEAQTVNVAMETAVHLITSVLPADRDLWFFTTDYWQKMMEFIVYDVWTPVNSGYDSQSLNMLYNTGLIQNASNYAYSWSNAIDTAYNNLLDRSAGWTGADGLEYTGSMKLSFEWNGTKISASNGSEDGCLSLDFCQYIDVDGDTAIYIDMDKNADGFETRNSGLMYNFSSTNKTIVKIDSPSMGTQYTLSPGMNDISSLPSGTYVLPAGMYAGPIMSLYSETSDGTPTGTVSGGLVLKNSSGTSYLVTSNGDEDNATYSVYNQNGTVNSTTNQMAITIDQYGGGSMDSLILGTESDGTRIDMVTVWDGLIQQMGRTIEQTYDTGLATWTIFDACEEKDSSIHPSSIVVNIPGQNLTSDEYIILYLNSMAQIHKYAEANEEDLNGLEITTNLSSLDLVCYGTIYVNGEPIAEDVVFTPYSYTSSQTFAVGDNQFSGTGSAIIWGQEAEFGDWDQQMNASNAVAIPLESGYVLEISKIVYQGDDVSKVDLDLASIGKYGTGSGDNDPEPVPVPETQDVTIYYLLIIAELGLLMILLGRMEGFEILMIVGLIVLAIGILIPQAIEGLVTGSFDWSQLKPFGWL